jgi:hypothetical protein
LEADREIAGGGTPIRGVTVGLLILIGVLASVVALSGGYCKLILLNSDRFADRAESALGEDAVNQRIATTITDQVILEANRDLVAFRPLLVSGVAELISSGPARPLFRNAVADFHRTAINEEADTATVFLGDVSSLAVAALETRFPEVSRRLPSAVAASLKPASSPYTSDGWIGLLKVLSALFIPALVLAAGGFSLAIILSRNRQQSLISASLGLATAGAICFTFGLMLRSGTVNSFTSPEDQAVARTVYDSLAGDFATWSLLLVAVSLVVAAAAAALLRPVAIRSRLASAARVVARVPENPWMQALRAAALVAIGLLVALEPLLALRIAALIAGGGLLLIGLEELLRLIPVGRRPAGRRTSAGPRITKLRVVAVGGLAALLITIFGTGAAVTGGLELSNRSEPDACNGRQDLCDLRINQVTIPMTHNSMAAQTIPDWNFPQQEKDVDVQLEDGIRGLMLDAYYGREVDGLVKTEIDEQGFKENLDAVLGGGAAEAALRVRDRLVGGGKPGPKKVWLCHGICEIGATPMERTLEKIRDFLVRNPNEVLTIVIQDEGVTPSDIADQFERSGLMYFVHDQPLTGPLPTLREMIDSGGRVLVFAENVAGGEDYPWYHDAFQFIQETPFSFRSPSEFSCDPNRGTPDAPLLLLNHWIDTAPTPRPSNADKVNARNFLLRRAERCADERNMIPNQVSVDFYRTGDLFEVVDLLNDRQVAQNAGK